jgi:hypothetical protein
MKFYNPVSDLDANIPTYNKNGDRTMSRVINKVEFNRSIKSRKKKSLLKYIAERIVTIR